MNWLKPFFFWQMFCLALLSVLVGCTNEQQALDTAPDFVGFISQIAPESGSSQVGQIIIESQANKVVEQLSLSIGPNTALFQHKTDKTNPAEFEDLTQQQWAHVWLPSEPAGEAGDILTPLQITVFEPEDRGAAFGRIGTLAGNVNIGPLSPVAREGVTDPTPMPEVYTSRALVIYEEDGQTEVKKVSFEPDGTYEVILFEGTYVVDIARSGIDSAAELPKTIQIAGGQRSQLDVDIDTGIR